MWQTWVEGVLVSTQPASVSWWKHDDNRRTVFVCVMPVNMYMYDQYYQQSLNQPGMGSTPGRRQLNSEKGYFSCPRSGLRVWSRARVQPYRPASAHSFATLGLNMVLTHGMSPAFRDGVHLGIPPLECRRGAGWRANTTRYCCGGTSNLLLLCVFQRCPTLSNVFFGRRAAITG